MANAETSLAASQAGKPLPTLRYSSSRPSLTKPSPPPTATTGAAGSRIKPGVPKKEKSEEVIRNEPPSSAGAADAVARVQKMLVEVGKEEEEEMAGVPHRPNGVIEELPPHASLPLSPVAAMTKAVMGRAKLDADPVAVLSRVRPGCILDPPPSPSHLDYRTPPSIAIHALGYPLPTTSSLPLGRSFSSLPHFMPAC